jgi:hypothetical protein
MAADPRNAVSSKASGVDRLADELELKYRAWFAKHPEALDDVATAFVQEHPASGTFVKRTIGGEVQIDRDEFEARLWVLRHPEALPKIYGAAR